MTLTIGKAKLAVTSLAEASFQWEAHRDANGLGASGSPKVTVRDDATGAKYRVSYNGRVWDADEACVYRPGVGR